MNVIERINMLKKMVKEAERIVAWQTEIYTALHNIHADWVVSGVLALARIPHHHTTHEPGGVDEVTIAPGAHKDTHDPEDGTDPLDTAVPVKVGAANAIGSSHSLARADHVHEREHAKTTAGELNLADMAEKAHGSLTGVTSGQHHARAHTLASHSTKAHNELTGVTASQHHTKYVHPTTGTCPQDPKAHESTHVAG
ncbi:unnamed protein product, partial [marine sediment metagenome]